MIPHAPPPSLAARRADVFPDFKQPSQGAWGREEQFHAHL